MGAQEVVREALLVLGAAFLLCVGLFLGHALLLESRRRRHAPRLERGRRALLTAAHTQRLPTAEMAFLQDLAPRLQVRLFTELIPSLGGSDRARLGALSRQVGLTARAESLCRRREWWDRLRGVRLLAALGGGAEAVPPLLDDRRPEVRAAAVEWAAGRPEPAVVRRLVEQLARPAGEVRFVLPDTLLRIGAPAVEPLARFLETHSGAEARAALDVAAGLPDSRFTAAALRLCRDADAGVRERAADLLGSVGGDPVVEELTRLLGDGDAGVRASACASLGRLGHWPAAAVIVRLLRDPAWAVRREAGLALRALGSPGRLLLRRALQDEDAFAADMARQVLDLPEEPGTGESPA